MTISSLSFSRRRPQPSTSGDDQEVGTKMSIGPSFSFDDPSRCVAIPPGGGTRMLQVWWQQEGKADCTAIQFFPSPTCKGRVLDTLAQGQQSPLHNGIRSARCIIGAAQNAAAPDYSHPSYSHPSYSHHSYSHPSYSHPSYSHLSYSHHSYSRVNPCLGGTCIDRGTEGKTCVCLPNHRSLGSHCNQSWEGVSSITVEGSTWRCKDVYTMYGLTLQQFTAMNPLSQHSTTTVLLHLLSPPLTTSFLLHPPSPLLSLPQNDTCSSVAQFLNITEESLQQLNTGVSCPSSLPAFRALCVERDPAKARPRCVNEIEIGKVVDFKQVAASNGVTMVDICRLNPWISFHDSRGDTDSVS
ncbi:unnamed protein product [Closterium sp. Yama58-4]|nr:unnamed protein product [Closterium sp. Yama58-4]